MVKVNPVTERRRNESGEVDYLCPSGHRVFGDNVTWRKKADGRKHPGCKECRRIYRNEYVRRDEVKARYRTEMRTRRRKSDPPVYSGMGDELSLEEYLGTEKRSVPWNLLRPRAEASFAFDDFHEALKYTDVPCRGREAEFTEYRDPRPTWDEDDDGRLAMPTAIQAAKMCANCPLIDQCRGFARLEKPDFGIWGGERFLGGKALS